MLDFEAQFHRSFINAVMYADFSGRRFVQEIKNFAALTPPNFFFFPPNSYMKREFSVFIVYFKIFSSGCCLMVIVLVLLLCFFIPPLPSNKAHYKLLTACQNDEKPLELRFVVWAHRTEQKKKKIKRKRKKEKEQNTSRRVKCETTKAVTRNRRRIGRNIVHCFRVSYWNGF